jgi:hypothetical protein
MNTNHDDPGETRACQFAGGRRFKIVAAAAAATMILLLLPPRGLA